jgi:hypothetical protein
MQETRKGDVIIQENKRHTIFMLQESFSMFEWLVSLLVLWLLSLCIPSTVFSTGFWCWLTQTVGKDDTCFSCKTERPVSVSLLLRLRSNLNLLFFLSCLLNLSCEQFESHFNCHLNSKSVKENFWNECHSSCSPRGKILDPSQSLNSKIVITTQVKESIERESRTFHLF